MSTVVKMADVFNRAVAVLDESGWIQGEYVRWHFGRPTGCCLLGAVFTAANTMTGLHGGALRLERSDMFRRLQAVTSDCPHRWNDERARTKDEVQEALREAARQSGDVTIDWGGV